MKRSTALAIANARDAFGLLAAKGEILAWRFLADRQAPFEELKRAAQRNAAAKDVAREELFRLLEQGKAEGPEEIAE